MKKAAVPKIIVRDDSPKGARMSKKDEMVSALETLTSTAGALNALKNSISGTLTDEKPPTPEIASLEDLLNRGPLIIRDIADEMSEDIETIRTQLF